MGGWIKHHEPEIPPHVCEPPVRRYVNGQAGRPGQATILVMPDGIVGDAWRCECSKVWMVVNAGRTGLHWQSVGRLRQWFLERRDHEAT